MAKFVGVKAIGVVVAVSLLRATAVWAEGPSPLLLPLIAALAAGRGALELYATGDQPVPRGALAFLPKQIKIPDLYSLESEARETPHWAEAIDNDNWVKFNLLPENKHGMMMLFSFDEESPYTFGDGSTLVRFAVEYRF